MKFTIRGLEVDGLIKKQLRIVCDELKSQINGIKSIILAGSFGYGEGPVKVKEGKIFPFNDYDIYIITDKPVPNKKVDEIASKVANKLGLKGINYFYDFKKEEQILERNFYVDLKCLTVNKLKKLLPRLRYYKFKESTYVLYGEDLRYLVPNFKLEDIPLSEPAKFLLDRMSQMVEYYSLEGKYCDYYLTYIIQQAYAAMSTALTMLSKTYKPSYKESMESLVEIYTDKFSILHKRIPDLHLKIREYIKWKLNPQELLYKDVTKEWLICARNLIEVSKYFFGEFLNKEINTIDELSKEIKKFSPKFYIPYLNYIQKQKINLNLNKLIGVSFPLLTYYLRYNYFKRLKKFNINYLKVFSNKYPPDSYIFASVPYLLSAISSEGVDIEKFEKARNLLNKVYPVKSKDWEGLSLEYANAYIAYFLQKIG